MDRLTTNEKYPHGAEGISTDNLTGRYCRGMYEATAVTERLAAYENTGLTPEQIQEMDALYAELCQSVHRWIPVSERLPEDGEEVLASDGRYVYLVEYDADLDAPFGDMDNISAWMPLPEPYKEEE